jgi:hypothetical protein
VVFKPLPLSLCLSLSWLSALSLSHPAIKNLLARSLLSMWSLLGPIFPYSMGHLEEINIKELAMESLMADGYRVVELNSGGF